MDLFSCALGIATKRNLYILESLLWSQKGCQNHAQLGTCAKMVNIMVIIWLSETVALKLILKLVFTTPLYI